MSLKTRNELRNRNDLHDEIISASCEGRGFIQLTLQGRVYRHWGNELR